MASSLFKSATTGAVAIASSFAAADGNPRRVVSVTVHFGVAPAAAGSLTITLDANAGAAYDTLLATESMVGVTNYVWQPDAPFYLMSGDELDVVYANADGRTYGCEIVTEA